MDSRVVSVSEVVIIMELPDCEYRDKLTDCECEFEDWNHLTCLYLLMLGCCPEGWR